MCGKTIVVDIFFVVHFRCRLLVCRHNDVTFDQSRLLSMLSTKCLIVALGKYNRDNLESQRNWAMLECFERESISSTLFKHFFAGQEQNRTGGGYIRHALFRLFLVTCVSYRHKVCAQPESETLALIKLIHVTKKIRSE